jgi:hypothetical protein
MYIALDLNDEEQDDLDEEEFQEKIEDDDG